MIGLTIFIFAVMSFRGCFGCAVTTKNLIKEIGVHQKYYPKRYMKPCLMVRKTFGLSKKMIPKWIHNQLCLAFIYVALFIVSVVMLAVFEKKAIVTYVFFIIYVVVMCIQLLHFLINMFLFRRKR